MLVAKGLFFARKGGGSTISMWARAVVARMARRTAVKMFAMMAGLWCVILVDL